MGKLHFYSYYQTQNHYHQLEPALRVGNCSEIESLTVFRDELAMSSPAEHNAYTKQKQQNEFYTCRDVQIQPQKIEKTLTKMAVKDRENANKSNEQVGQIPTKSNTAKKLFNQPLYLVNESHIDTRVV